MRLQKYTFILEFLIILSIAAYYVYDFQPMKRHTILCLLFGISLLLPHISMGQKEAAIWYFGFYAGLDFNFSPPKAIQSPNISTHEGCSSVSNDVGNLLFYTDGRTVWNKQHTLMENGNDLRGDASSTHSSVVVKKPLSDTEYYIITSDDYLANNLGVNYSTIDLTYNNGLGKIVSKNNPLVGASAEKIAVISHLNKKDIWVAIPELNTTKLYIYLVTENGFELKAIYSDLFPKITWGPGQIKFSPDGKHLAFASRASCYIMDFDNSTGQVSSSQLINGGTGLYGVEFSPNSQYVYVTSETNSTLCQCNVLPGTSTFTNDCKLYPKKYPFGALQLGPDQKIYIAKTGKSFLGVVEFPDSVFTKTGYIDSAITLIATTVCRWGLPTFNTTYVSTPIIKVQTTCLGDTTRFSVDTAGLLHDSISWLINGQSIYESRISGSFVFNQTGTFSISVIVHLSTNADTTSSSVSILPRPVLPEFSDTSVCIGQSITFNARREPDVQYQWNTGSTDSALTVTQPGLYIVNLTKKGCSVADSIQLSYNSYPVLTIPDEIVICMGTSFAPTTISGTVSYLWSTGDTTSSVALNSEGSYWVAVTTDNCTSIDTFSLFIHTLPVANLGPDTGICENQILTFKVTHPYSQYLWNTGSADPIFEVTKAGLYSVQIENLCGVVYDSIQVRQDVCNCLVWAPNAFTPNGDQTNDLFIPSLSCDYKTLDFRIYTKWGEEIFRSTSALNAWDGRYKGSAAPADVYVWKLSCELTNTVGKEFMSDSSGTVTLLR